MALVQNFSSRDASKGRMHLAEPLRRHSTAQHGIAFAGATNQAWPGSKVRQQRAQEATGLDQTATLADQRFEGDGATTVSRNRRR